MLIAAGFNEALKIAIGNVDVVYGEALDAHLMGGVLVVPAEFITAGGLEAKCGAARFDFDEVSADGGRRPGGPLRTGDFALDREAMEHIGERFRVHEAVLDGDFEHGGELGMAFGGMGERLLDCEIQLVANAADVALDFLAAGPIGWCIARETAADGIDAEGEELIKGAVKGREAKGAAGEQVPVEGLHMTEIKDDAMALRNGAVVEGFFTDDLEQFIGARARLLYAGLQSVTGTC